jgi:hypothetical protein
MNVFTKLRSVSDPSLGHIQAIIMQDREYIEKINF